MSNLEEIFNQMKSILEIHSDGLYIKEEFIDSKANIKKPSYHLYGSKDVSLFGKNPNSLILLV